MKIGPVIFCVIASQTQEMLIFLIRKAEEFLPNMTEALAHPYPPPPPQKKKIRKKEKKTEKKKLEKRGPTYSIQTVVRSTCVPHVFRSPTCSIERRFI